MIYKVLKFKPERIELILLSLILLFFNIKVYISIENFEFCSFSV